MWISEIRSCTGLSRVDAGVGADHSMMGWCLPGGIFTLSCEAECHGPYFARIMCMRD